MNRLDQLMQGYSARRPLPEVAKRTSWRPPPWYAHVTFSERAREPVSRAAVLESIAKTKPVLRRVDEVLKVEVKYGA